ncbi:MAG: transposase, partial [Planctomycetota bacterium]
FSNITADKLVRSDHAYRKIEDLIDFKDLAKNLESCYSKNGAPGFPVEQGVRCLILQFMEDYSDRQMEAALQENVAVKWFCGFELGDGVPDYSYFSKLRKRLGTERIAELFKNLNDFMEEEGLIGKCFSFVDSTAVITKTKLWDERDRAIEDGLKKLDNATVKKYSADRDARFGCKGKNKYWFGYKKHVCVDAKAGMITKVAMTPANESDASGLEKVCPKSGMVMADKAYCGKQAQNTIKGNGCHSGAIQKENMKEKNRDKDKWLTGIRMPFEGVFSKTRKRTRYRGIAKVQMQGFLESIAHNIKTYIKIQDRR